MLRQQHMSSVLPFQRASASEAFRHPLPVDQDEVKVYPNPERSKMAGYQLRKRDPRAPCAERCGRPCETMVRVASGYWNQLIEPR